MKIQYDSYEEYDSLRESIHDSILYWKKVRQMCQGKINLNADPNMENHYTEEYAVDMMVKNALILDAIEKSPHPEWNSETQSYELVSDEYDSAIVAKCKRLIPKVELDEEVVEVEDEVEVEKIEYAYPRPDMSADMIEWTTYHSAVRMFTLQN